MNRSVLQHTRIECRNLLSGKNLPAKRRTALLLLSVGSLFACSSGDAPTSVVYDPAGDVHLPRATGDESLDERNAIARRADAMLLDAPDSEYIHVPAGLTHKSCAPVAVPNDSIVDPVARTVRTPDGKVIALGECKYKHKLGRGATSAVEQEKVNAAITAEAAEKAGNVSPQCTAPYGIPGCPINGSTDTSIWPTYSGTDPALVYCSSSGACKLWFDAIWGEAYVPPLPRQPTYPATTWPAPNDPNFTSNKDEINWFNSIDDRDERWILQPVLNYNDGYGNTVAGTLGLPGDPLPGVWHYRGESWLCYPASPCVYSQPILTYSGDYLTFQVITWDSSGGLPGHSGGGVYCDPNTGFNCNWRISIVDTTTGSNYSALYITNLPNLGSSSNMVSHAFRAVTEPWFGPNSNGSSCQENPMGALTFRNAVVYQPAAVVPADVRSGNDYHDLTNSVAWWDYWTPTGGSGNHNYQSCTYYGSGGVTCLPSEAQRFLESCPSPT